MKVFVIGATGYIGSHVAKRLVEDGQLVSGLARTDAAAARLASAGIAPVRGEAADQQILREGLLAADVTIFTPQLTQEAEQAAVLDLLGTAAAAGGKTFVFTSGTGVLAQRTCGDWSEDSFAEDDPFIPLGQLTTRVATEQAVRAAASPSLRTLIVRPPAILGYGHHWQEAIVRKSIAATGAACYVGPGLNITSNVHMDDLVDLYALALERGQSGGLYHASAGEVTARALAEAVAVECGCGVRSLTMDEGVALVGRFETLMVLGVCSRSRSPRSRALGWSPRRLDMLDEVRGRGPNPPPTDPRAF